MYINILKICIIKNIKYTLLGEKAFYAVYGSLLVFSWFSQSANWFPILTG